MSLWMARFSVESFPGADVTSKNIDVLHCVGKKSTIFINFELRNNPSHEGLETGLVECAMLEFAGCDENVLVVLL